MDMETIPTFAFGKAVNDLFLDTDSHVDGTCSTT